MHSLPILLTTLLVGISTALPSSLITRADENSPKLIRDSWAKLSVEYQERRPYSAVTRINRWPELVPNICYSEGQEQVDPNNGRYDKVCVLDDLEVLEVFFADSVISWIVCRCRNAYITEDELLEKIGRIPIGMRQHARHIMSFRDSKKGRNRQANAVGDVLFFGVTKMKTYIHEFAHQVDRFNSPRFSSAYGFRDATIRDSCWTSSYAKKNGVKKRWSEVWAEVFVFREMMKRTNVPDWGCMENQLNIVKSQSNRVSDARYTERDFLPKGPMSTRAELRNRGIAAMGDVAGAEKTDYLCSSQDDGEEE